MMLLISTIACLAGICIVSWLHNQHWLDIVVIPVAPPAGEVPLISICVPARNEARNIRRCVEALLAQTYPEFELIVLDDRSTDETPRILGSLTESNPRLRVMHGKELPDGWAGKPHALAQAAACAQGEWLCFIDADTFSAPELVASAYAKAVEHRSDLFSILTAQEMGTFWEKTVLPLVFTALSVGFSPRKVNDPARKDAIANGQFILIKRSVYEAVGGHTTLRGSIVEDKDMAELVKSAGYRLTVADGRQVASTRMYTSLQEIWEGWTKNIFLGLAGKPRNLLLGVFGAFLNVGAALLLPLWLAGGLAWWGQGGGSQALIIAGEAAALWGAILLWRGLASRGMGISAWYALTTPLGAGIFAAMMFASTFKVISGRGVTWKGRTYH